MVSPKCDFWGLLALMWRPGPLGADVKTAGGTHFLLLLASRGEGSSG